MAKGKVAGLGTFDTLFNKSVPHILEKIFSSLDYDSFMMCRKVCKVWYELLSTQSYKKITEKLKEKKEENEERLCLAASNGNVEEITYLLSEGVDINCNRFKEKKFRLTPLHFAALRRHQDVVRLLMNEGADPNTTSINGPYGESLLYYVVQNEYVDVLKLLLDGGADPTEGSNRGTTPLHVALLYGNTYMINLLLGAIYKL